MGDLLERLPPGARGVVVRAAQPDWIVPMLATLTEDRFSDPGWIYERKLDGERCLAFRRGREVHLLSRNRLTVNAQYPEIVEALARQPGGDFVLDGEIVAFDRGRPSFSRLQRRMHLRDPERARRSGVAVFLYVFDVPHAGGYDLTRVALRDRKTLLRDVLEYGGRVRFTAHRNTEGKAYWGEACRKGWEGVIAKRADSAYRPGRSRDWLKFKCVSEQEFVIGGFTDPKGSRVGLGAVLVGCYRGDDLVYAGKVGTGFDQQGLASLVTALSALEQPDPPFTGGALPRKEVHWVRPELVCQVGFAEWTPTGQLRHPRFLGLRRDKDPRDVVREVPV